MDNIELTLRDLGLRNAEVQTYKAISLLGEARVGDILKKVSITASNVHGALNKLLKKGLVSFIKKNEVKVYKPAPINSLKQLIENQRSELEEKEKKLNEILPKLNNIIKNKKIKQDAEVFFEFRGIKSAFQKLLSEKKKGEEYLFFYKQSDISKKEISDFFFKLDKDKELYRKFKTKAIFNKEYEKKFKKTRIPNIEVRFTNHPIPTSINIYDDKVLIIAFSDIPIAFLIQSDEIAGSFKDFFYDFWKMID